MRNKNAVCAQLDNIASECNSPNWGTYGELPTHQLAINAAKAFVNLLPDGVALPDSAPEPTGDVSLDWCGSDGSRLSVGFSRNSMLSYAWLDGSNKGYGVEKFDGESIPKRLFFLIRSI